MSDESSPPPERIAEALEEVNASLQGLLRRVPVSEFPNPETPVDYDPFKRYDRLGRRQPSQLSWMTFFRRWPSLLEAFRPVPQPHVDYSGEHPVVDCPCDDRRKVEAPLMVLVDCPNCHRSYFGAGARVLVTYRDRSETAD